MYGFLKCLKLSSNETVRYRTHSNRASSVMGVYSGIKIRTLGSQGMATTMSQRH